MRLFSSFLVDSDQSSVIRIKKCLATLVVITAFCLSVSAAVLVSNTQAVADEISDIVDNISVVNYTNYLRDKMYTHYGDDRKYGPEHDLARNFIQAEMTSFGLDVSLHQFYYSGTPYYNVVGVHRGTVRPDEMYIIGGHYDSVGNPGADDNASGTSCVLEAARVLSQYDFEATIIFIAFDREEQGLYGSYYYAEDHQYDDIRGMISADMVSFNPGNHNKVWLMGRSASNPLKNAIISAFANYSGGVTAYSGSTADYSDHAPFEWLGFQATCMIEYDNDSNPYYHTQNDSVDTPNYIDFDYAAKVTKGAAAYLAVAAVPTGGGGDPYELADPVPGLAGMKNTLTVTGATPGYKTYFVYGMNSGSTSVPPCPGLNVEINNPIIAGSDIADSYGIAEVSKFVPNGASGLMVYIQAVEMNSCVLSNLVQYQFP